MIHEICPNLLFLKRLTENGNGYKMFLKRNTATF